MTPEEKAAWRRRLAAAGFRRGSVQEFLGLSDTEMAGLEITVTSEPAAARVQREELAKGNPRAIRFDQHLRTIEMAPPKCPKCGESVGADCGEPCTLITWNRGPGDPPGIGPTYHTRCHEEIEARYAPVHDPAECVVCAGRTPHKPEAPEKL